eukprot:scaffold96843_cov30-Attheya_sp.AAC.1
MWQDEDFTIDDEDSDEDDEPPPKPEEEEPAMMPLSNENTNETEIAPTAPATTTLSNENTTETEVVPTSNITTSNIPETETITVPTKRVRRWPQRFRDLEFPNEQLSTRAALNRLYRRIRSSKDKLFLVHNYPIPERPETWYLVQ